MSSGDRPAGRDQPGDIARAISRHTPREEYATVVWRLFEGAGRPMDPRDALLAGVLTALPDNRDQLGAHDAATR